MSPPPGTALLWRWTAGHRGVLAVALAVSLAGSAAALAQPIVAQRVMLALGGGGVMPVAPVVALTALIVVSAVSTGAGAWLLGREGERIVRDLRRLVAGRLVRATMPALRRHAPGDLVARVTADTVVVRTACTSGFVHVVDGAIGLLGTGLVMLYLDTRLTAVAVAVLGLVAVVLKVVLPRLRAAVARAQGSVGLLGAALDRAVGAAATVKANRAEDREIARMAALADGACRAGETGARHRAVIVTVTELSVQVSFVAVLGIGGALVAAGELSVAALVGFLLALFHLTGPVGALTSGVTELQQGSASALRIDDVLTLDVEPDIEPDIDDTPLTGPRGPAELRLEGVRFAHPGGPPLLRDVSFTVAAGSVTALVGPSGSGKSTLLALLLRFLEPTGGRIVLDGRDLCGHSRAELRDGLAWVDQDSTVLDGTLAENLRLGAPAATEAELVAVLGRVRLDGLLDRAGLHGAVGPRGVGLSGGERQRVAIARALLRSPRILLLDEVTANLDRANERALRQVVQDLAGSVTVLLVAHRAATIAMADSVVALDSGRVRRLSAL